MSNVIELFKEKTGFDVDYILDKNKKVIGITHPKWPFTIMSNGNNRAIVWNETDDPFGILPKDEFNTVLMCWLLIDDPKLIDDAALDTKAT